MLLRAQMLLELEFIRYERFFYLLYSF